MLRERHVVVGYGHGMNLTCSCGKDSILKQSCKEDGFRTRGSNLFTCKSPKGA